MRTGSMFPDIDVRAIVLCALLVLCGYVIEGYHYTVVDLKRQIESLTQAHQSVNVRGD